ncbi:hypothetical protein CSIRO_0253 [Bradyrhizobiaceae bacterium SG-6C]|nr:hypothetical protein CSIRO_0253 [Bradyrhizobiaceae bacterium SG-6C]
MNIQGTFLPARSSFFLGRGPYQLPARPGTHSDAWSPVSEFTVRRRNIIHPIVVL